MSRLSRAYIFLGTPGHKTPVSPKIGSNNTCKHTRFKNSLIQSLIPILIEIIHSEVHSELLFESISSIYN